MRFVRYALGLICLLQTPAFARADGGTLRFSKQVGDYRMTLFTSPTLLRVGPVDFSVLLVKSDSESLMVDVPVTIVLYPVDAPQRRLGGTLTTAAATNKLFQAIQVDLPEAGRWHVEVQIHDPKGLLHVDTEVELGPPLPSWLELGPWIGWPVGVILLFVIHQRLVGRRNGQRQSIGSNRSSMLQ